MALQRKYLGKKVFRCTFITSKIIDADFDVVSSETKQMIETIDASLY